MSARGVAQSVPVLDDLYFVQAESGPVKIGRAKRPGQRLRELQTGCFEPLELLYVLEGRGFEEKVWHRAFCAARKNGEWFELTDELDWAIACAIQGKPWWDHLTPPPSFPLSEDPDEREDDFVDWQIAVHIAVAGAAEKAGLSTRFTGKALFEQDNEPCSTPKRERNIG
jgi:hypothetical protein